MSTEFRRELLYKLLIATDRNEIVSITQKLYNISKCKAEIMADLILTA